MVPYRALVPHLRAIPVLLAQLTGNRLCALLVSLLLGLPSLIWKFLLGLRWLYYPHLPEGGLGLLLPILGPLIPVFLFVNILSDILCIFRNSLLEVYFFTDPYLHRVRLLPKSRHTGCPSNVAAEPEVPNFFLRYSRL